MRRGPQVTIGHDVVPLKHRRGLVPGKLHRHALGHASTHHAPHGRPSQVVWNATRAPGRSAGRGPCLRECADRFRVLRPAPLRAAVGGEVGGGHSGCVVSSGPERAAAACEGVGVARSSRSWPQQPAPSTQTPPRRSAAPATPSRIQGRRAPMSNQQAAETPVSRAVALHR